MPCRLNGGSSSARVKTVRLRPAGFDGRSLFTAGRSDCLNSGNSTRRDGSRVCCFVFAKYSQRVNLSMLRIATLPE